MAAGATYEPISTTTLGSTAATVTLSSIPGNYTDLILVISATVSGATTIHYRLNSDASTNYSVTVLQGNGSTVSSFRGSNEDNIGFGVFYTTQNNSITHLQNYSNTTTYKTLLTRYNNAGNLVGTRVALWRSTAAISSIYLYLDGSETFGSGSTFTLYGIAAA